MLKLGVRAMLWQHQGELPVVGGASLEAGHGDMLVFGGPSEDFPVNSCACEHNLHYIRRLRLVRMSPLSPLQCFYLIFIPVVLYPVGVTAIEPLGRLAAQG